MGAHVFFRGIRHNGAFQPLYRHLLSRTLYKRDARQTILGVRAYIPGDMPVDLQCLHTPYATSSLLPAPTPWPYIADFTRPEGHTLDAASTYSATSASCHQQPATHHSVFHYPTALRRRQDLNLHPPPEAVLCRLSYVCLCPRWATSSRGARGPVIFALNRPPRRAGYQGRRKQMKKQRREEPRPITPLFLHRFFLFFPLKGEFSKFF